MDDENKDQKEDESSAVDQCIDNLCRIRARQKASTSETTLEAE